MELVDLILGNYDKDSPEHRFTKILKESYRDKFNIDEFDSTYNDVAGYKPVKTSMEQIAKNYIDSFDLNDADNDYVLHKFNEAYEDVADKNTININAIIDGIIDEIDFSNADEDEDESDLAMDETEDDFNDDDIDFDSDDD